MYVRGKRLHTAVALSNSEGQTAGGTRERQQRRALATTPQGAGRVGVTKRRGKICSIFFFFSLLGQPGRGRRRRSDSLRAGDKFLGRVCGW